MNRSKAKAEIRVSAMVTVYSPNCTKRNEFALLWRAFFMSCDLLYLQAARQWAESPQPPIELDTVEKTALALEPISRIVPTTMIRITASITAYSATS
jgi:hypothetical protein